MKYIPNRHFLRSRRDQAYLFCFFLFISAYIYLFTDLFREKWVPIPPVCANLDVKIPDSVFKKPPKFAVVTLISSDSYVIAGITQAYSMIKVGMTVDRIVMVPKGSTISEENRCLLRAWGWKIHAVEIIYPKIGSGNSQWRDVFTKLRAWELYDYSKVIFLDADVLVTRNFEKFFQLEAEFAGSPDTYDAGVQRDFNSGFMVLTPSKERFEHLVSSLHTLEYSYGWADQAFLNRYFECLVWKLPAYTQANSALATISREFWDKVFPEAYMIHYTWPKPFNLKFYQSYRPEYNHIVELYHQLMKETEEYGPVQQDVAACKRS
jgi:hypothetical protein